jgi:hypothetical protein
MMSPDGRFVAFATSDQVVTGIPAASYPQIYLTDNCLGGTVTGCTPSTILISSVGGTPSTKGAFFPAVAQGGRYVSFSSTDPALVPGATITQNHYFLRDTCIGASSACTPSTTLIDIGADGVSEAVGNPNEALASQPVSLSASGRYVLFNSIAQNLVTGLTPPQGTQFYLRDTCNGAPTGCTPSTILLSPTEGPITLSGAAYAGPHSLSDDGRFAVFAAALSSGRLAIYMRDTCTGAPAGCVPMTKLVSADPNSISGSNPTFTQPIISGDGKYVAFTGGGDSFTYFQLFLAKAPEFIISAPVASLNPTSVDFGSVPVGQTSVQKQVTLTNSGNSDLDVTNINISGSAASEFSKSDDCPASLTASSTCTITVLFTPSAEGSESATLSLTDNAADSPQSVELTGSGGVPKAALSPASFDFGNTTIVGKTSQHDFTLTNSGSAPLAITSVTITGSNANSFSVNPACGSSVNASGSGAMTVSFVPSSAGAASAQLTVVDSAGTQTASLTGTGTAPNTSIPFTLSVTPNVVNVVRGQSAVFTVHVLSLATGNEPINPVALSVTNVPKGVTVTFSPVTVTPGTKVPGDSIATVTIAPDAVFSNVSPRRAPFPAGPLSGTLVLAGLVLLAPSRLRKRAAWLVLVAIVSVGCALSFTACSTGPTGNYINATVSGNEVSSGGIYFPGGASAGAQIGFLVLNPKK